MHCLDTLTLSNYLLYEEAEFEFREGISLVGGENRTGKSLLLSGLAPLLYHKNQGGGVFPSESNIKLGWSKDKDTFDWGARTGKSTKFSLFKNSQDLHTHKMTDAYAAIRNDWHLGYELFTSTVMLSGTKPHPLTIGKASSMNQWLSDVLNLTYVFDDLYSQTKKLLEKSKEAKVKAEVLSDELKAASVDSSEQVTKKEYMKAKKLVASSKTVKNIDNVLQIKESLDLLLSIDRSIPKLDTVKSKVTKLEAKLSIVSSELKAAQSNSGILDKIRKMKSFLSNNKSSKSIDDCEEELRKLTSKLDNFSTAIEEWQDQKSLREKLKDLKPIDLDDAQKSLDKAKFAVQSTKDEVDALQKPDNGKCSSCGSKVEIKDVKKLRDKLLKTLKGYEKDLSKSEKQVEKAKLYARKSELVEKPKPIKGVTEKIELVKIEIEKIKKIQTCKEYLKENKHVSKVDVDELNAKKEKLKVKLKKLKKVMKASKKQDKKLQQVMAPYRDLSKDEIDVMMAEINDTLDGYDDSIRDKLRKANETINAYNYQKQARKKARQNIDRLKSKVSELQPLVDDFDSLKALEKAFGKSGLRLLQLQEAANMLSEKLTELSSLMFNEPYKFIIDIKERSLSVNIERRGKIGDLTTLSGSESRVWPMTCAMSLIHILPQNLRCDTMILDELEANLDANLRDRYTTEFLPELKKIVPKVIVVTPQVSGELNLTPDHQYRITNTNGISSVTEC